MKLRSLIPLFIMAINIVLGVESGRAFSLLGPFEPWMEETNDLRQPGDIGGPMCISNEYRWDVPVVTYGFDPSFIDFFGTNGETAVENAIQVINDLPPASQIILTNYPLNSTINSGVEALGLLDLKSWTLSLLLEQMGLAQPTRYIFVLRQWNSAFIPSSPNGLSWANDWPSSVFPDYIAERNFDPQTFDTSLYVNDILYTAYISSADDLNLLVPTPVDVEGPSYSAVADRALLDGEYYSGLTEDDVGGLRYLYSTNNVNYETLLPDVSGIGGNSFVNGAWRPGVNKISFVSQPVGSQSGTFLPMTNYFTDTYITNGVWTQQQLMRVTSQPDFLFCAGDVPSSVPGVSYFTRTGTTNWLNNATANGNTNGAGPGIIRPQIQIVFQKLGPFYSAYYSINEYADSTYWASYDDSTNAPITYPIPQTGTNQMTVRMWLYSVPGAFQTSFAWKPCSLSGAQYAMQTSMNLTNWTTLFTVTNNGSVCTFLDYVPTTGSQFYRLIPQ